MANSLILLVNDWILIENGGDRYFELNKIAFCHVVFTGLFVANRLQNHCEYSVELGGETGSYHTQLVKVLCCPVRTF